MKLEVPDPRVVSLAGMFGLEPEPEREKLLHYSGEDGCVGLYENDLAIVMNRDITKNVDLANCMSLVLARRCPERRILLVNTYAGPERMQISLAKALKDTGNADILKKLEAQQKIIKAQDFYNAEIYQAQEHSRNAKRINAGSCNHKQANGHVKKSVATQTKSADQSIDAPFDPSSAFDPLSFFPNLRILTCPTSTLTAERLEEEMRAFDCETVILNSFEFATMSQWDRHKLARGILDIRSRCSLTMLVFSHEQKVDVRACRPSRGGLGALSAYANSVWRLMTEYEKWQYERYYYKITGGWQEEVQRAEERRLARTERIQAKHEREMMYKMSEPFNDYAMEYSGKNAEDDPAQDSSAVNANATDESEWVNDLDAAKENVASEMESANENATSEMESANESGAEVSESEAENEMESANEMELESEMAEAAAESPSSWDPPVTVRREHMRDDRPIGISHFFIDASGSIHEEIIQETTGE